MLHNKWMRTRGPRLKILHLNEKTSLSTGSVIQMILAARQQAESGEDVSVVTRPSRELATDARLWGYSHHQMTFRHEADLGTILGLRELISAFEPDVIHVHKGKAHSLVLPALIGNPGPVLVVNRGVSFPLTWTNRPKYQTDRVDRIVTVCRAIRNVVIETGRVDPDKVHVVYAGTDVHRFDPERVDPNVFRHELGLRNSEPLFTHAGIRPWKGCGETARAFVEVRRRFPRARLAFIGFDGRQHTDTLRDLVRDLGISDSTAIIGHRPDMERVLAASDGVLDASWAGTGITGTIREGMAMARPVIATDCGGNVELVNDPSVGWLVPPRDVEALSRAMIEAVENPEAALARGRSARRRVLSGFSMEHRGRRLASLYREARTRARITTALPQPAADRSY